MPWKRKWSLWHKIWVTGGTKIWPGIPSNWRIFEPHWLGVVKTLNIESIWLNYILQLLGIPGQILVSLVTQLFRSKWQHFFQCVWKEDKLTRKVAVHLRVIIARGFTNHRSLLRIQLLSGKYLLLIISLRLYHLSQNLKKVIFWILLSTIDQELELWDLLKF